MVIASWYWPEGLPWSVTLSEAMSVGLPVWEWLPEGGGNRLAVWREGEYPAMLSAPWVCPEVLPVRTHTSPHTQPVNYHISCHLCILLSKNWNRAIIVNGHMPVCSCACRPPPSLVSLAHVTLRRYQFSQNQPIHTLISWAFQWFEDIWWHIPVSLLFK